MSNYFLEPTTTSHKQYEALRAHYVDGQSAAQSANLFGYTLSAYYSLMHRVREFGTSAEEFSQYFFQVKKAGRRPHETKNKTDELIIELRKKYLSVPDIKAILDTMGIGVSETYVYKVVHSNGFARLPRRNIETKVETLGEAKLEAPESNALNFYPENFTTQSSLGILCLIPYIERYRIDKLLENSNYPETKVINRLSSLLSFVALKLSNVKRYSRDDMWCMDRGLGLFASLNVLPKTAWLSSYSHRVTRSMNLELLRELHKVWLNNNQLSDTANLDFTTIPYWGDDSHLENNWSGTRHKALPSVMAVLAQDPDTGI